MNANNMRGYLMILAVFAKLPNRLRRLLLTVMFSDVNFRHEPLMPSTIHHSSHSLLIAPNHSIQNSSVFSKLIKHFLILLNDSANLMLKHNPRNNSEKTLHCFDSFFL